MENIQHETENISKNIDEDIVGHIRTALKISVNSKQGMLSYLLQMAMIEAEMFVETKDKEIA